MKTYKIDSLSQLLDLVGASGPDPHDQGPVVVRAVLWDGDGRIVQALYYKGPKYHSPDAETRDDMFFNTDPLVPLVEGLLERSESFVTVTGTDDMVCCLEWEIIQIDK